MKFLCVPRLSEWKWNFVERALVVSELNDAMIDAADGEADRRQFMINIYCSISYV